MKIRLTVIMQNGSNYLGIVHEVTEKELEDIDKMFKLIPKMDHFHLKLPENATVYMNPTYISSIIVENLD